MLAYDDIDHGNRTRLHRHRNMRIRQVSFLNFVLELFCRFGVHLFTALRGITRSRWNSRNIAQVIAQLQLVAYAYGSSK